MSYHLREDLYFCRVDDRLVFMDIQADAYFLLHEKLEKPLSALIDGHSIPQTDLDSLLTLEILTEGCGTGSRTASQSIVMPCRSAAEETPPTKRARVKTILEVACTVYSVKRRLRARKLKELIHDHLVYRQSRIAPTCNSASAIATDKCLMEATSEYSCAKRHVPIETACLLDSLSLLIFLSRRGLFANLVFGVTLQPFSAHAWLQAGDMALNESVSYARTHKPILVL